MGRQSGSVRKLTQLPSQSTTLGQCGKKLWTFRSRSTIRFVGVIDQFDCWDPDWDKTEIIKSMLQDLDYAVMYPWKLAKDV